MGRISGGVKLAIVIHFVRFRARCKTNDAASHDESTITNGEYR